MTKEEIRLKAVDNAKEYEIWPPAADYQDGLIKGFEDGAEWMLYSPTGGALLYTVEKTAERAKRETLIKVERFLIEYFCNSHYAMPSIEFGIFMKDFKQAMQDEGK